MARRRTIRMKRFGNLLLTRARGREIAVNFEDEVEHVTLDFDGVDAASPSFLDETIRGAFAKGATEVVFKNTTDAIDQSVARLLDGGRGTPPPADDDPDPTREAAAL